MHDSGHRILSHPDYLLSSIDADRCRFAVVSEQTYRQSAFLDHRMQPMPKRAVSMATSAVLKPTAGGNANAAELIIAHSSFCASTLLARTLDADDVLVLREPQLLGQLANLRRTASGRESLYSRLFPAGINQLCKRYQPEQKLVLKLSNYANNLLPDMMQMMPDTRLLLLLGSLDDLLVSMHNHAAEAELTLPKFLHAMLLDQSALSLSPQALARLDLFQQTALLWHLQLQHFQRLLQRYPDRTRLLLTTQFMADPVTTVAQLDAWIGARRDDPQRSNAVAAMLDIDAKARGGAATPARTRSRDQARQSLRAEIKAARDWASAQGLWTDPSGLQNVQYLCRR